MENMIKVELENKERLFILRAINSDLKTAKTNNKVAMLYALKKKFTIKKTKDTKTLLKDESNNVDNSVDSVDKVKYTDSSILQVSNSINGGTENEV